MAQIHTEGGVNILVLMRNNTPPQWGKMQCSVLYHTQGGGVLLMFVGVIRLVKFTENSVKFSWSCYFGHVIQALIFHCNKKKNLL